jgi:hypothetical protein
MITCLGRLSTPPKSNSLAQPHAQKTGCSAIPTSAGLVVATAGARTGRRFSQQCGRTGHSAHPRVVATPDNRSEPRSDVVGLAHCSASRAKCLRVVRHVSDLRRRFAALELALEIHIPAYDLDRDLGVGLGGSSSCGFGRCMERPSTGTHVQTSSRPSDCSFRGRGHFACVGIVVRDIGVHVRRPRGLGRRPRCRSDGECRRPTECCGRPRRGVDRYWRVRCGAGRLRCVVAGGCERAAGRPSTCLLRVQVAGRRPRVRAGWRRRAIW